MASNCSFTISASVNLVSVTTQTSGYCSMSLSRSWKDRGVNRPSRGLSRNCSRVGTLVSLTPACQPARQSWRSTTCWSAVRRRSTSNTRTPFSYWAWNPSRQLRVARPAIAPMPWAMMRCSSRISAAVRSPGGGSFSSGSSSLWGAGSSQAGICSGAAAVSAAAAAGTAGPASTAARAISSRAARAESR